MAKPRPVAPGRITETKPLDRRAFVKGLVGAAGALTGPLAAYGSGAPRPARAFPADVATTWFDQALELVRTTAGFSPPVASRAFGYAGVTLFEALVPGMPDARSLAGQLNGLASPPGPAYRAYHWPTVANSALAAILGHLFPTAPQASHSAAVALEEAWARVFRPALPPGIYRRSVARGQSVADHIFAWSLDDGGHEGYLHNFPSYTPPAGPGLWQPTPPEFLPALQPFWGANRPFVLASGDDCAPGAPLAYSTDPSSACYAEALEVRDTVDVLSPEQRVVAMFWSDDPGQTATPPGHSVSILTQVLRSAAARLDLAAEAYARVGMAVADAFIACWKTKYRYNLLRPLTFVRDVMTDPSWTPLLTTPPFPEYTSGHSVQSGAAAEVLTALFGDLAFTDHTHDARGLAPRAFDSFWEAAREAAISRLYGGIHFRRAIVQGLAQGRCVGQAVNALDLRGAP